MGEAEAGDGAGSKAGLAVGSAPCNSPSGGLVGAWKLVPVGIASL